MRVSHGAHPLQPLSGPCSIEKYPPSRMANRYTRIFDAGGFGGLECGTPFPWRSDALDALGRSMDLRLMVE